MYRKIRSWIYVFYKHQIAQRILWVLFGAGNQLYNKYGNKYFSRYSFGGQTKYYCKNTEQKVLNISKKYFSGLKGKYKGERCFIIGNGPSLNKQNLLLLKDEFTIGSNYIFLNYEKMGFIPNILTVVNYLVAQQRPHELNKIRDSLKIFPFFLRYCMKPDANTVFLNSIPPFEFSTDITDWISWRSTVTYFNMQIAYYLGFNEVYLIGVDHSYVQPKEGKEGVMIKSSGDDPNHFDKNYFGKGIEWQKADTDTMAKVYLLAKDAFEEDGRKIYNATAGGKLELYERVTYESLFKN